jgi:hypothetical protein
MPQADVQRSVRPSRPAVDEDTVIRDGMARTNVLNRSEDMVLVRSK